jgi:hypothetical protein
MRLFYFLQRAWMSLFSCFVFIPGFQAGAKKRNPILNFAPDFSLVIYF